MYRAKLNKNIRYDCEELIKVFLKPTEYEVIETDYSHITKKDKNSIKGELFKELCSLTGLRPPWGILTGIRPVKVVGDLFIKYGNELSVRRELREVFFVTEEKIDLLIELYLYQQKILGKPKEENTVSVYIGIPFCPTRCSYCSFTSNQSSPKEILRYLEALKKEVQYVGKRLKEKKIKIESLYIGGGTPTSLSAGQLDDLIEIIKGTMELRFLKEFTVEAGRPDTITMDKLRVIKNHGIDRISINPQSMKKRTLELIGRNHEPHEVKEAFYKAKSTQIGIINADLIAGLPEESPEDFKESLREIIRLGPKNITIHTLAVKRASKLEKEDPDFHYKKGEVVAEMLTIAEELLRGNGYRPYYLYRQKHMAGGLENIGWCKDDTPSVYNIRIMEENQSIIALGAGGISKLYFPGENRLERVANVSNYQVYIERLDEMIKRKEKFLGR